ncbi:hypothetical protein UCRPC4_g05888 [Phaeomoniella chlamydospora]|uniref:Uncharacterized protein n=1 Tax=Phaeomoniella chlamydospora TaxID=158046 RepID=A0A0G2E2F6_PHACM|nr:hypothetical protein UCRPC4_g05888 [Phaeomoniella chlamydospora]
MKKDFGDVAAVLRDGEMYERTVKGGIPEIVHAMKRFPSMRAIVEDASTIQTSDMQIDEDDLPDGDGKGHGGEVDRDPFLDRGMFDDPLALYMVKNIYDESVFTVGESSDEGKELDETEQDIECDVSIRGVHV